MIDSDPLAGLNPEQRAAALSRRHTLVIACPGSGKTKTVAAKAALFLREGARVAAATFTRDAAMELRERIVKEAGAGCQSRLLVGTFHSIDLLMAFPTRRQSEFGSAILKDMKSPFSTPWKIIDEGDRRGYVIRAMNAANVTGMQLDEAMRIIEVAKATKATATMEPSHVEMVAMYRELLQRAGKIDLQDIILLTNDALADGSMSPLPVDYLMIDEFQDTDRMGFSWAAAHAKAGVAVTVVGDDDQSIYSFRDALGFDGLRQFETMFQAQRILLDTNYRCHAEILGSASHLIRVNTERIEKSLVAAKGPGGSVGWASYEDTFAEAGAAAKEAKEHIERGATFAIIARTNRRLDEVQAELIQQKIPHRRSDGSSIFNLPEVQVYGAALRTVIQPTATDVDEVLSWAGAGEEDLAAIHRKVGENIYIGAAGDFADADVSAKGLEIWRSFAKRHAAWQKLNKIAGYSMLNLSVREWLEDHLRKPYQAQNLYKGHALYATRGESLEERLKSVGLAERSSKTRDKKGDEKKADDAAHVTPVDLITAHGSKGLEYDGVFIIGLEEGVFPSKDTGIEEERRLMFVGMTRARKTLFLGSVKTAKPSIFLAESGVANARTPTTHLMNT
ncbi:ATP-dependent helicase [Noviherbaspirillum pedocola]|uniref:DNA 3'-5' helicase n=1 Tax=Noviherbaspirillum pedocola TaxID=2801341 RepID=A0A934SVA2_9BURK|nr:ATP-dependent helicase [Noviherbaspirillum pedocola]MBK4736070.1 ATP-dependent helicase [Noviherbaspirillum pedocola]